MSHSTTAEVRHALQDALYRIGRAWAVPLAQLGAVRQPTGGDAGWGTPVSLSVLDIRTEVAQTVYGWARVLIEDRRLEHARIQDSDVAGMCRLIATHADWLSGHEAADDMVAELTACAARLESIAPPVRHRSERRPGERVNSDRRMPIGECALIVTGTWVDERGRRRYVVDLEGRHRGPQCGGRVVATLDEWEGADATCRSCGTSADVGWWEQHVQPERVVTIRRLSEILAVVQDLRLSEKAIGRLIERGVLVVAGRDPLGRRLIERSAALEALATRRREAS